MPSKIWEMAIKSNRWIILLLNALPIQKIHDNGSSHLQFEWCTLINIATKIWRIANQSNRWRYIIFMFSLRTLTIMALHSIFFNSTLCHGQLALLRTWCKYEEFQVSPTDYFPWYEVSIQASAIMALHEFCLNDTSHLWQCASYSLIRIII